MTLADRAVLVTAANRGNAVETGKEDTFPDPRVTDYGRRLAQRGSQSVRARLLPALAEAEPVV